MSLTTPERIRTLQRKLYIKAKQEPAYRFYANYDKIFWADVLNHAWRLVCANGGNSGVDGVSFKAIEGGVGVGTFLRELSRRIGTRRMPWCEEHRKAVCGKTARTV
jgi:RNA-directed DNA polymerase